MRILFYDVETANHDYSSICSVGWVLLHDCRIIQRGGSLIDPRCDFNPINIGIHGINPEMVSGMPTFAEYWESTLRSLMESSLIIAYNADFDMNATADTLSLADIPIPDIDYLDALPVMRRFVSANSYKLSSLAKSFGLSYHAHDASDDAEMIFRLLDHVCSMNGFEDIPELLLHSFVPAQSLAKKQFIVQQPSRSGTMRMFTQRSHCKDTVDATSNELSCLRFCITGDIPGYSRSEVERLIMEHGGKPTTSVSSKTDYLVIGEYLEFGPDYISTKQRKAQDLINHGGNIRIIDPQTLFSMMHLELRKE